jgi:hypothetical protein
MTRFSTGPQIIGPGGGLHAQVVGADVLEANFKSLSKVI